eukprot:m.157682 g.157682  ORF g.157682 m.157682 type:complete len:85 (-) comp31059_c0_seq25:23-277(-)
MSRQQSKSQTPSQEGRPTTQKGRSWGVWVRDGSTSPFLEKQAYFECFECDSTYVEIVRKHVNPYCFLCTEGSHPDSKTAFNILL